MGHLVEINRVPPHSSRAELDSAFWLFDLMMEEGPPNWVWGYTADRKSKLIAFGECEHWIAPTSERSRKQMLKAIGALQDGFDDWIQIDADRVHDPEYLELLAVECWGRIVLLNPAEVEA